ncbi:MAG: type IV secretory system conjugative DNA transfer family protein [Eggerthellaceae bacterium]|nr:type IV secretory system conjugative DNA transfer family protein [Eggerthellaceae bacterium]
MVAVIAAAICAVIGYRAGALTANGYDLMSGLAYAEGHFFDMAAKADLMSNSAFVGMLIGFALPLGVWAMAFAVPRPERAGEEHGSARWSTKKEIQAYANAQEPDQNILLTRDASLAIKREKFDLVHDRNLNVLVVGGSGSGKTRYFVKPNLMQLYGDYVVTDPKGTTLLECGHLFVENGYKIASLNTVDFPASNHYNPLKYVHTDAEILSFVNCLIANTNGKNGQGSNDPFWENAEKLLYVSIIALMRDWFPARDYTLPNLLYFLSLANAQEENEDYESPLDLIFKQIETGKKYRPAGNRPTATEPAYDESKRGLRESGSQGTWAWIPSPLVRLTDGISPYQEGGLSPSEDFALSNYKAFKTAAGKTLKSIIISCNVRLKPLEIKEISDILAGPKDRYGDPTGECELELDKFGDPDSKRVLFGVLSDTDKTFSFLLAILMWQSINVLCNKAIDQYGGKLPRFVDYVIDEFANIGTLPDIEKTIAVTRSRNIGLSIILQSIAQMENNYSKEASEIIRGNCDTQLYLGGTDLATNKEVSELIGQQTINVRTFNESRGQSSSSTRNYQTQQRALIDPAEVGLVPRNQALLIIKGEYAYKGRKYILEEHPRYEYIDPGHQPYKKKEARHEDLFNIIEYKSKGKQAGRGPSMKNQAKSRTG